MIRVMGFDGIDFFSWVVFKMLIQIYGEDKLIAVLEKIKKAGGVDAMTVRQVPE